MSALRPSLDTSSGAKLNQRRLSPSSLPRVRFAPPDPWISARYSAQTPDGHPPERHFRRHLGKRKRTAPVQPSPPSPESQEENKDPQGPALDAVKAPCVQSLPRTSEEEGSHWPAWQQTWVEAPVDYEEHDESEDIDVMPDKCDIYNAYNVNLGQRGWAFGKKFRKDDTSSSSEDEFHLSPVSDLDQDDHSDHASWVNDAYLLWTTEAEERPSTVVAQQSLCLV